MTHVGWHFLPADGKLANGDGRPVPVGEWLTHDGQLAMCRSGLHWSPRAIDALRFAPGPVACRIQARGKRIAAGDKCVSSERRALWMLSAVDGNRVLRAFARQCAADVLPLWDRPVPSVVVRWLASGDDALRAAAGTAAGVASAGTAAGAAVWAAVWAAQNARLETWLTAAHEGRWPAIAVVIPVGVEAKP